MWSLCSQPSPCYLGLSPACTHDSARGVESWFCVLFVYCSPLLELHGWQCCSPASHRWRGGESHWGFKSLLQWQLLPFPRSALQGAFLRTLSLPAVHTRPTCQQVPISLAGGTLHFSNPLHLDQFSHCSSLASPCRLLTLSLDWGCLVVLQLQFPERARKVGHLLLVQLFYCKFGSKHSFHFPNSFVSFFLIFSIIKMAHVNEFKEKDTGSKHSQPYCKWNYLDFFSIRKA